MNKTGISRSWVYLPLLFGVGLLSACDQASQLTQQAASSVVAIVGDEVKRQTNDVIDQVSSEAQQVLQPLGIDASRVASAVKSQTVQLAQQVLKTDGNWLQLMKYQGKFPQDIGLFAEVSPISPELKKVLGNDLTPFLAQMSAPSSLQIDQVLYVLGNKLQAGNSAWLVIDVENRRLEAGLIRDGKVKVYSSAGEPVYRPAEVADLITKAQK
jgi:hypothetical protein